MKTGRQTDVIKTLAELDRGRFLIECGREMRELTDAIRNAGNKKGTLVIRLEVAPSGMREGRLNQVEIKGSVAAVRPKPDVRSSIFFVSEDSQLTREDPDQLEMFDGEPVMEQTA